MKSQSESSSRKRATCALVFPLRLGVFLIATWTFFLSWFLIIWRDDYETTLKTWRGGYVTNTKVYGKLVEFTAWPFALCGIIGAWNMRASRVKTFQYWQFFHILYHIYQIAQDYKILMDCKMYKNNITGAINTYGMNGGMYAIATGGQCKWHQESFQERCMLIYTVVVLYMTYVTQAYLNEIDEGPKYLLKIPAMAPSGAFVSESKAEKAELLANARGHASGKQNSYVGESIRAPDRALYNAREHDERKQSDPGHPGRWTSKGIGGSNAYTAGSTPAQSGGGFGGGTGLGRGGAPPPPRASPGAP